MKYIIKRIFFGSVFVVTCLLIVFAAYGIINAYIDSFNMDGIMAILSFIYATLCFTVLLFVLYIIGDAVICIREKNMKKKALRNQKETI